MPFVLCSAGYGFKPVIRDFNSYPAFTPFVKNEINVQFNHKDERFVQ